MKRLLLKLLLLLFSFTLLSAELKVHKLHDRFSNPIQENKIKFLDAKEVLFHKYKKIPFSELSGIEYKDGKLYGVGDKGYLYFMSIDIEDDKIKSLTLDKAFKVKQKGKKHKIDTEGIIFRGDYFYISYERDPRVEKISLEGKNLKSQKLNKELKKSKNYQDENKGLEAIAYSKKYGIITAPELPLKNTTNLMHTLFSKETKWSFPYTAPLTSMAFMSKNKLLLIQRDYDKKSDRMKIYLTQVNLKKCVLGVCSSKTLTKLDSKKGWNIDNFEGLASLGDNRFLMISDNNNNPKQKTLLVLFEVLD